MPSSAVEDTANDSRRKTALDFICLYFKWVRVAGSRACSAEIRLGVLPLAANSFLTYSHIGIYCFFMARAATTTDVFNAIAEPRRREIVDLLVDGQERAVGDLVSSLQIPQPAVSKHLGGLRRVG